MDSGILYTSVLLAKGRPGSRTTEVDSGPQKRLRRSCMEGYGPRPQARTQLARVEPPASIQASSRTMTAGRTLAVGTFSKSAILQRFPNLYTLRVEIFWMFFCSRLPVTPMNHGKFHGNRSAFFREIRKTDTHRDRCGSFIYI